MQQQTPDAGLVSRLRNIAEPKGWTAAYLEQVCVAQALLDILAHALVALARERVPHVDRRVTVARALRSSAAHDSRRAKPTLQPMLEQHQERLQTREVAKGTQVPVRTMMVASRLLRYSMSEDSAAA